MITTTKSEE